MEIERTPAALADRPLTAYLAWGAICVIWGTTYMANKVGIGSFPPLLFCGVRFLTAGLILQAVVSVGFRGQAQNRVPLHVALSGILMLGIGTGMVVWAQQWLPTGLAAVLVAGTPFWLILAEAVIPGGTRPSLRAVLGLLAGLAGVMVITSQRPVEGLRADYLWAVGGVLLAGMAWSLGSIFTQRHKTEGNQLAIAARQMLWGGGALVLGGIAVGERLEAAISPDSVAAFAYLVVFGSLVAYVSYLHALKHLPVAFVSTYMYVNPVLALWLGWMILDESLTDGVLLASALVLVGVALAKERRQPRAVQEPSGAEQRGARGPLRRISAIAERVRKAA